ncbi:type IV conjugative transfer system protein TraE [Salmonella enterica]|uniref:Type IV conjugative transfer system protein TraE n=2 Tax=Salmonella enterica I TaxID=59201 RepID=A0A719CUH6_SALTS|nr:type IV conjugative transfer system protein TraE [Salmonella enterica]EBG3527964.1 type IV conjugative transfer system protein TraE [Salmonella enterica subsp. enterica]EBR8224179.1 type IV conjugative transfer system protein TraE [Salmonella enterica subsp. enterica serovar Oranienburg]EBS1478519.1 type IV conjugative transfer system protein TraE [Salmonella enterica subsp. enterica serovar Saintpaul]EBU7006306.1 type IV conjugative transfer system protein TraE [Salmonella enterica subsp. e
MDVSVHRSASKYTSLMFVILLVLLSLSLAANLLAWLRVDDLQRGQKETYIPMFFNQPFSISRNQADASYLQQVAESVMFLRLNVTPESVKAQHKALLRYVPGDVRASMQDILASEAQQIITNNVSTAFYMSGIDVYPLEGVVDFRGTLRTWIGKRESLPEEKQFRLVLKYRDGITTIRDFKEVVNEKDKKD